MSVDMKSRGRAKHRWQVCISQWCPEKPVAGSRLRVQVQAEPGADVGAGVRDRAAVTHEEMMPQCRGSRGRAAKQTVRSSAPGSQLSILNLSTFATWDFRF